MKKILLFLVLSALSVLAQESAIKFQLSFETYSLRRAIVQGSISASQMPFLEPKGEYEKQSEFDACKDKYLSFFRVDKVIDFWVGVE